MLYRIVNDKVVKVMLFFIYLFYTLRVCLIHEILRDTQDNFYYYLFNLQMEWSTTQTPGWI